MCFITGDGTQSLSVIVVAVLTSLILCLLVALLASLAIRHFKIRLPLKQGQPEVITNSNDAATATTNAMVAYTKTSNILQSRAWFDTLNR